MTQQISNDNAPHFACESSLEAGEVLYASASRVDVWLLLEYNAVYENKALAESTLPVRIKSFLNQRRENLPNVRFQFIRQAARQTAHTLRFYVARANQEHPTLYRFDLTTYGDLLDLDIPAIASGQSTAAADERLFIVCTNGKRDVCCARHGLPLYRAVSQVADDAVWETTHLGGHRFAGTMACLPHGLYYGRVRQGQAEAIVESYHRDSIVLEHYRGCAAYDAPLQAADYFLRQQTGLRGISDLQPVNMQTLAENHWRVEMKTANGEVYTVEIEAKPSDFEIYESTANTEKNRVTQYHRVTASS